MDAVTEAILNFENTFLGVEKILEILKLAESYRVLNASTKLVSNCIKMSLFLYCRRGTSRQGIFWKRGCSLTSLQQHQTTF